MGRGIVVRTDYTRYSQTTLYLLSRTTPSPDRSSTNSSGTSKPATWTRTPLSDMSPGLSRCAAADPSVTNGLVPLFSESWIRIFAARRGVVGN